MRVGRRIGDASRRAVYFDESHVWYAIDAQRFPERELPPGYVLQRITPDSPGLDGWDISPATMAERTALGGQAWGLSRDGVPAFRCWIFPDRVPTYAARGRVLDVAANAVCLEDSFTFPDARGRGLAGTAWALIGRELRSSGYEVMITKIGVDNVASRRAVEKIGFRLVAQMHYQRTGPWTRVRVAPIAGEQTAIEQEAAVELARQLER